MIAWPDGVINSIARRRSVILIGSGVSANAMTDDGRQPPTWGDFLRTAYDKVGRRIPHIQQALKRFSYLEACDYIRTEMGEEWASYIRAEFVTPNYKPAKVHEVLFNLDSRIVASLNFDKIYENYAVKASEDTVIVKSYYDADMRDAVSGVDRYVIKPHGTVDTVSRLIFTLEQYGKARTEHSEFYDLFSSLLHTHTFICIGCGLSDPDLQLIFEDYRYRHKESPHFIILPAPVPEPRRNLIKRTRGMTVITYNPKDSHSELTKSLESLASSVSAKREEIALTRNW